jgi:hypothetical protein
LIIHVTLAIFAFALDARRHLAGAFPEQLKALELNSDGVPRRGRDLGAAAGAGSRALGAPLERTSVQLRDRAAVELPLPLGRVRDDRLAPEGGKPIMRASSIASPEVALRDAALALLRTPDLLARVLLDFTRCGHRDVGGGRVERLGEQAVAGEIDRPAPRQDAEGSLRR